MSSVDDPCQFPEVLSPPTVQSQTSSSDGNEPFPSGGRENPLSIVIEEGARCMGMRRKNARRLAAVVVAVVGIGAIVYVAVRYP